MHWLTGNWSSLYVPAVKAVLMYATALLALRLGERRTLAQWTLIDFATAVAVGAVVGRTAIASGESYVVGAVAITTFVAVHRLASLLRFSRVLGKLVDHRVRLLLVHGKPRGDQLHRCGLTLEDLYSQLRQRGFFSLEEIRYVIYETKGSITVVPESMHPERDPELVHAAIESATDVRG